MTSSVARDRVSFDFVGQKDDRTNLENGESLDTTSVGDMRASAEIDHGTTAVDGRRGAVGDLGVDELNLEGVILRWSKMRVSEEALSKASVELTANILSRFSLETIRRSNFCLSLTTLLARVSRAG